MGEFQAVNAVTDAHAGVERFFEELLDVIMGLQLFVREARCQEMTHAFIPNCNFDFRCLLGRVNYHLVLQEEGHASLEGM